MQSLYTTSSQLAKIRWTKYSDQCHSYFFNLIRARRSSAKIHSITDSNGSTHSSPIDISRAIVTHFENLLGIRGEIFPFLNRFADSGIRLTSDDAALLTCDITQQEIKEAFHCIGINKAPGPDSFGSHFFKKAWSVVGSEVTSAVSDFFRESKLLKSVNHSIISLVPKTSSPTDISHFRPISCCTTIYKAIAKIIANRIKAVLPGLININQGAFIPGRSIRHNSLLCQELLKHYGRANISPRCAIKIDIRRAFDTISHNFILQALHAFGFPPKLLKWVKVCITTVRYSININGTLEGYFLGQRGLRQGCPMSPYLFALAMEYLSRLVHTKTRLSNFNFHPKCERLSIIHLCFADDLIFFARGDVESVRIIKEALDLFGCISGLLVNQAKSNVFFGGVSTAVQESISSLLNFPTGTLPMTYLGMPMGSKKLSVADFGPLISKITRRVQSWAAKTLSYAGRVQLINSVLMSIQNYWSNIFVFPVNVLDKIESLLRNFLWTGKEEGRRNPIAWEAIARPKDEGGLGFKELLAWNKACSARSIFELDCGRPSLWSSWVSAHLLKRRNIWTIQPKDNDSWVWKTILRIRTELLSCQSQRDLSDTMRAAGGKYSTSQVYELLRSKSNKVDWSECIWGGLHSSRCSFITWLALHQRLPTLYKLNRWGLPTDDSCKLCNTAAETEEHLWLQCSFTKSILDIIFKWLRIDSRFQNLSDWARWLANSSSKSTFLYKFRCSAITSFVYYSWMARNKLLYQNTTTTVEECAHQIMYSMKMVARVNWKRSNGTFSSWRSTFGL